MGFVPGFPTRNFFDPVAMAWAAIFAALIEGIRFAWTKKEIIATRSGLLLGTGLLNTSVIFSMIENPNPNMGLFYTTSTLFVGSLFGLFVEAKIKTGRWFLDLTTPPAAPAGESPK